jgi:hypothetical protein
MFVLSVGCNTFKSQIRSPSEIDEEEIPVAKSLFLYDNKINRIGRYVAPITFVILVGSFMIRTPQNILSLNFLFSVTNATVIAITIEVMSVNMVNMSIMIDFTIVNYSCYGESRQGFH